MMVLGLAWLKLQLKWFTNYLFMYHVHTVSVWLDTICDVRGD